ncbi:MAG: hypothetical protein A2864_02870 [Candidatus Woykebacteria bacterium RIFCSPHIGHO2_01_FULL_39_12]|uniref:Type 4 fimbrial biogenesis protein PilX N-terminal domain-containing protein n=2 Tax=Candidatus Woykeibacteriota TaxID=1817899 RepID=A0A1G1WB39_9BACT|nr:MAG: hypothetical protein A2134_01590 [Candidatus Woykebacteria bacterium RBG_16_39_9b]OGY27803.1 MAG: hypothetical protein A2864_02870 [Candidatus Woykebacteria bacterium RIFCSPHIGHO2_01_FULL_39_12]
MNQKGQALVSIVVLAAAAAVIAAGAALTAISLSKTAALSKDSDKVYYLAESGAEEALLALLRDPTYTGNNQKLDNTSVVISVTGINQKTIISEAFNNNVKRRVEVLAQFTNNILTITSWKEIE